MSERNGETIQPNCPTLWGTLPLGQRMSELAEKGTFQQGGPRFYLPNGDGTFRRLYERIVIRKRAQ
jgi:hypothetical protein